MKNSEPPFLIVEITYKSLEPNVLITRTIMYQRDLRKTVY